jgi:hypothetical protein
MTKKNGLKVALLSILALLTKCVMKLSNEMTD